MRNRRCAWMAMVTVMLWAIGLSSAIGAETEEFPYPAVVIDDQVPIRAGAGTTFYIVGHLPKGAEVIVDEVIFGWHKIVAPPDTYSYISQNQVVIDDAGVTGTIDAERAAVKAASLQGPGDSYRRQLYLLDGHQIQIVGQEGGYYKITPPEGAYVFLPPGSVEQVDPAWLEDRELVLDAQPPIKQTSLEPLDSQHLDDRDSPQPPIPSTSSEQGHVEEPEYRLLPAIAPETSPQTMQPTADAHLETLDPTGTMLEPIQGRPDDAPTTSSQTLSDASSQSTLQWDLEAALDPTSHNTPDAPDAPDTPDTTAIWPEDQENAQMPEMVNQQVSLPVQVVSNQETQPVTASPDTFKSGVSPVMHTAEQWVLGLSAQPIEQQPIDEMIATYEHLLEEQVLTLEDLKIVKTRLALLRRNAQIVEAIKGIESAQSTTTDHASVTTHEQVGHSSSSTKTSSGQTTATVVELTPLPSTPSTAKMGSSMSYNVMGRLQASSVYNGVTLPQMFRVVEPGVGRTLAYIKPGQIDLPAYALGRYVGIVGVMRYDPALKLSVIEVQRVDVLEPLAY